MENPVDNSRASRDHSGQSQTHDDAMPPDKSRCVPRPATEPATHSETAVSFEDAAEQIATMR
jgi:hypothetical protein